MSILQILYYPDKRLRKIAKLVNNIDDSVRCIVNDMLETMYFKKGIGLSGTQVNIHNQIFVIDISKKCNQPLVFINPKLLKKNGKIKINEGCLSIPDYQGLITRFKEIKISALDYNGNLFKLKTNNLLAVCIQHEMDHLIGKLIIDYFEPFNHRHAR